MSKSNVNPNHYKVAGRERQGEDIAQDLNKQKHAENVASRRTEIGARSQKLAPELGAASPDAAPTRAAKSATRQARTTPLQAPPERKRGHNLVPEGSGPLSPEQARKKASVKLQGSDKRGKRSAAQ